MIAYYIHYYKKEEKNPWILKKRDSNVLSYGVYTRCGIVKLQRESTQDALCKLWVRGVRMDSLW